MAPLKKVDLKDPLPPDAEILEILRKGGWGEDATWLAPIVREAFESDDLDQTESIGECAEHNTRQVVAIRAEEPDRNTALFAVFIYLSRWMEGFPGPRRPIWRVLPSFGKKDVRPEPALPDWLRSVADTFRQNGLDFESAVLKLGLHPLFGTADTVAQELGNFARFVGVQRQEVGLHAGFGVVRYLRGLVHVAKLRIDRIVDLELTNCPSRTSTGDERGASAEGGSPSEARPLSDVRRLDPWLAVLGCDALTAGLPLIAAARDAVSTERATGEVCAAFQRWLELSGHFYTSSLGLMGPSFAKALAPYLTLFVERCGERASASDKRSAWRQTWIRLANFIGDADTESKALVPEPVVASSLRIANEEFAALRKILARAKYDAEVGNPQKIAGAGVSMGEAAGSADGVTLVASAKTTFEAERRHFSAANRLLCRWGGYWGALKPLLLAWRSLSVQGVARDLRWWGEPPLDPPPHPWADLFMWPVGLFQTHAHIEERVDPELMQLRSNFVEFCLERITDRLSEAQRKALVAGGSARTDADMVERSSDWRYCLVRAAASLGVNPEGRGHRALDFSAKHDPSEEVRGAAKDAFERLRRGVGLPEGVSPRRAVISALWWLRQAHLLGLGIEPLADGAQRTRAKELSRTKEDERAARLAANQDT